LLKITGEMGNNPYYYPPWFAWLFIPLVGLPFQIARIVWMVFNVAIWNLGLWNLGKLLQWPPEGWRRYGLYLLATFSFAWITWRYEQAGIIIFMLLVAVIGAVEKKRWGWTGVLMALLLIKPNVTLIVIAALSLWLLRERHWQPVVVMIAWLGALLAVSTWITPDWYKPFSQEGFGQGLTAVLDGPNNVVALRINTTFLDWLRTLGVGRELSMTIYVVALIAGIVLFGVAVWRSQSVLQLAAISLLISYALTPYAMQYDNPPLVIVVFWALSSCAFSTKSMRIGIVLAAFIFSVIFWQQNISWAYWIVVGCVALAAWATISQKNYSTELAAGTSSNS
jgi:hypothetical protein